MKKIILLIIFMIFAFGFIVLHFNKEILNSSLPTALKSIIYLLNPPCDLYIPIIVEKLDENNLSKIAVSFKNRYFGLHTVDLMVSKSENNNNLDILQIEIGSEIECSVGQKIIFSGFTNSGMAFLSKYGKGITLFTYQVPTDMPLDQRISCSVKLHDNYHSKFTYLYIRKASDL